jgi:hypothetical protein
MGRDSMRRRGVSGARANAAARCCGPMGVMGAMRGMGVM